MGAIMVVVYWVAQHTQEHEMGKVKQSTVNKAYDICGASWSGAVETIDDTNDPGDYEGGDRTWLGIKWPERKQRILSEFKGEVNTNPIKAIRERCLECSCGQISEVAMCVIPTCALWPFRFGKNPYRADVEREEVSEERKAVLREQLAKGRKMRTGKQP